ncbi:hypothetical protein SLEP1_g47574 [Rubroshorea leprosula]|uniref:Uncharacterized protein n=1 Tax=Rubroshorea leprosula TaxID=152421 RepID=A0AAV5LRS5_9ROSI|nr:hypothetical protein SLEP1_g47574 [Rubroshorea leprosula]
MASDQDEETTEFLGLRQQLKELIRTRNRGNLAGFSMNVVERMKKLPCDNYGSFFGPSQATISKRVMEESRVWQKENLDSISKILLASMNKSSDSLKKQKDSASSITEMKKKIEQLKMSRDYSFLHDDGAKLPPVSDIKDASTQGSEALKSKQALGNNGRQQVKGVYDDAKLPPALTEVQVACGKGKLVSLNSVMHSKAGSGNSSSAWKFNSTSIDSKKQLNLKTRIKPAKSKAVEKKQSGKTPPNPHKEASSDQMQSNPKPNLEVKIKLNQPVPLLEPQDNKAIKYVSSQVMRQVHRPKKRPPSESEKAIEAVREMFNTKRFANRDDRDDGNMEANFDDIMKEERRSAKLARKEDAEQLRLIEEEERRKKLAKKPKLCHKTQQNP